MYFFHLLVLLFLLLLIMQFWLGGRGGAVSIFMITILLSAHLERLSDLMFAIVFKLIILKTDNIVLFYYLIFVAKRGKWTI